MPDVSELLVAESDLTGPDDFAVIRIDLKAVRESKLVRVLPDNLDTLEKGTQQLGVPISREFLKLLSGVKSAFMAFGPPSPLADGTGLPVSVTGVIRLVSTQTADLVKSVLTADGYFRREYQGCIYYWNPGLSESPAFYVTSHEVLVATNEEVVCDILDGTRLLAASEMRKRLNEASFFTPIFLAGTRSPAQELVMPFLEQMFEWKAFAPELAQLTDCLEWATIFIDTNGQLFLVVELEMRVEENAEQLRAAIERLLQHGKVKHGEPIRQTDSVGAVGESSVLAGSLLNSVVVERKGAKVHLILRRLPEIDRLVEVAAALLASP